MILVFSACKHRFSQDMLDSCENMLLFHTVCEALRSRNTLESSEEPVVNIHKFSASNHLEASTASSKVVVCHLSSAATATGYVFADEIVRQLFSILINLPIIIFIKQLTVFSYMSEM